LYPDPLDPLGPSGRAQPRRNQYAVAANFQLLDRQVPWSVLLNIAENCDVVNRCIDLVQSGLSGRTWSWGFSDDIIQQIMQDTGETNHSKAMLIAKEKYGADLARVIEFFKRPDPRSNYWFSQWLVEAIWQCLVLDAVVFYPQYTLGGKLYSISGIDGASIKILKDNQGFPPEPPAPAYQQILYGFPRGEYQASDGPVDGEFLNDQLMYYMRRPRPTSVYGYPQVEEVLTIAMTYLARQAWMAAEYCYDDQTEILTESGWKLFKNLDRTERVASRNDAGEFVWEQPTEYVVNDWTDELIEFKSPSVDLLVTPNHRMLLGVKTASGNLTDEFVLRADETSALSRRKRCRLGIPTTSKWTGTSIAEKIVPTIPANRRSVGDGFRYQSRPGFTVPMRAWCEFLGLYVAEGSTVIQISRRRHDVVIVQSVESPRLSEMRRILASVPFHWQEYLRKDGMIAFTTSSVALAEELKPLGLSWQKYVPSEIKSLPVDCLEAFINGFWLGDGFIKNKDDTCEVRGFATSSPVLADDLQELLQKCGHDSVVSVKDQSRWAGNISKRLAYQVVERSRSYQPLPKGRRVPYMGSVYCVSVPTGLLYVRRNGRSVWCGNTYGAMPKTFITTSETETWTPEQLAYYENVMNDRISGQIQRRQQMFMLRPGMKPEWAPQIDEHYKSDYDNFLIGQIASKFGVPGALVGVQAKAGLSGGKQMEGEEDQTEHFIFNALINHFIDILNDLARRHLNVGDEITATCQDPGGSEQDIVQQATADSIVIGFGGMTINDYRADKGLPLYDMPEADEPFINVATGPVFLKGTLAVQDAATENTLNPPDPPTVVHVGPDGKPLPTDPNGNPMPPQAPPAANNGGTDDNGNSNVDSGRKPVPSATGTSQAKPDGSSGANGSSNAATDDDEGTDSAADKPAAKELAAFVKFVKGRAGRGWRDFTFVCVDSRRAAELNELGKLGALNTIKAVTADPPTCAGIAVVAQDTGRVLMLQRAISSDDPASGKLEWPGGHAEGNETPLEAALREFAEETGVSCPSTDPVASWGSRDGTYRGYVMSVPHETDVAINTDPSKRTVLNPDDPDGDMIETAAWFDPEDIPTNPAVRSEVRSQTDWSLLAPKANAAKAAAKSHPVNVYRDKIVSHYAPLLAKALQPKNVKQAIASAAAAKKASGDDDASDAAAGDLTISPTQAAEILKQLVGDSVLAGSQAAVEQIGGGANLLQGLESAAQGIDWDTWQPGNAAAADLARDGGLQDLLDRAGITIQSVIDNSTTRLGNAIADGLASGDSADTIAGSISDLVSSNAYTVAVTESARATSAASMETYDANGIEQWDWDAEPNACPECDDNASNGPYDVGSGPTQPAHTSCRCDYQPVTGYENAAIGDGS
jgi:8-oxo-dGTP pyrophosphatase MutT (NUDIX family)